MNLQAAEIAPPPTAQAISLGALDATPAPAAAGAALVAGTSPLHAVRARLQACAGEVELTVGELLAAREHQVLVLDRGVDEPVDLLLEGRVVARGQLVAVDGVFGVRITELPVPLAP
jgi:flagellar motor switch protein FliN/FliY